MKNRHDFANKLRKVYELQGVEISKREADVQIDNFFETLSLLLQEDNKVAIHGLLTVEKRERAAHKGRNPIDGSEIDIPAGFRLTFKVGKKLKDKVL